MVFNILIALPSLITGLSGSNNSALTSGKVTFKVVTSFGKPLKATRIHVDGSAIHKDIDVAGTVTISLPYGSYRLTSASLGSYWPIERTFEVIESRNFVLIALPPIEAYAKFGEGTPTPYTLSGKLKGNRPNPGSLLARLRGLYLVDSAEAEVDPNGHFDLAVKNQGIYTLDVLDGELVIASTLIRLDESKERPIVVDITTK
jgi:hypothetical protein